MIISVPDTVYNYIKEYYPEEYEWILLRSSQHSSMGTHMLIITANLDVIKSLNEIVVEYDSIPTLILVENAIPTL